MKNLMLMAPCNTYKIFGAYNMKEDDDSTSKELSKFIAALLTLAVLVAVAMLIWNSVVVPLFLITKITYWQTLGLMVLLNIVTYPIRKR